MTSKDRQWQINNKERYSEYQKEWYNLKVQVVPKKRSAE